MKKISILLIALCVISIGSASFFTRTATGATITGYDVRNALPLVFSNWNYTYSGTISTNASSVDLQGGSGTMNNGSIESLASSVQLFISRYNPVITLHLDRAYYVSGIEIYGGDIAGNYIPGALAGWTVGIGGSSQAYSSTPFGNTCTNGGLCDDRVTVDLSQAALATDTITLSAFTGGWGQYFSIAEIKVTGTRAVPEPAGILLLSLGIMGIAGVRTFFTRRARRD